MSDVTNPNAAPFSDGLTTVDYSALVAPIDRAAVREFKTMSRLGDEPWASLSPRTIIFTVGSVIFGIVFVSVMSSTFQFMLDSNGRGGASLVKNLTPILVIAAGSITFLAWWTSARKKWARRYRIDSFATTNGLVSAPEAADPAYNGVIFQRGSNRSIIEQVTSTRDRFFAIGNYRYTTGSGDKKTVHQWGFVAIRLDRRLPHMVLDARVNNGMFGGSNLPTRFTADQVLSLEGDFNSHFRLYCPREYERDALYVFTPDLMALFIDNAASFDAEIVDDWMFVYSSSPLDTLNPAMWQRMFQIVQSVGSKTVDQSEHYRDERVVPAGTPPVAAFAGSGNRIAPQGQRLRKRTSWVSIVVVVGIAASWYFNFFAR